MNRQATKKILKIGAFAFAAVVVIGYALFAFHDYIQGPQIILAEPENGQTFATSSIVIQGIVKRSQDITLNGKSILIDDKGNFSENSLLAPGYNDFELVAKDRFGHSKEYRLELVYKVN